MGRGGAVVMSVVSCRLFANAKCRQIQFWNDNNFSSEILSSEPFVCQTNF